MRWLILFFFCFTLLEAKIVTTNSIEQTLLYMDKSSWVLFGVDDTLIEGENQLGRIKWYYHETRKLLQKGLSEEKTHALFYPQWILSQTICPFRTVEVATANIVAKAQTMAQKVFALSARHPPIASLTVEQLSKLKIDFSQTAPELPQEYPLESTLYRNGVWFVTHMRSKGSEMNRFLNASKSLPKRIVFINDNRPPLEEMEKILETKEIEFIGIHYTKAQERLFDERIADLQHRSLPQILSDNLASAILESSSEQPIKFE